MRKIDQHLHRCALALAIVLAGSATPALAQHNHQAHQAQPAPAAPDKDGEDPVDPHAGHTMPGGRVETEKNTPVDHEAMGHGAHEHGDEATAQAPPLQPVPILTDADRAAAFPDVAGHTVHDTAVHWFADFSRLETWNTDDGRIFGWEGSGWVGTDTERVWLYSELESSGGRIGAANVELLYSRAVASSWDALIGVRHEFGAAPSRTLAALGVSGQAPYMIDVSATAYIGEGGQTGLNVEAGHETLFTNKLILQSVLEAEAWSNDDPARGIGSGLSKAEAGLRLRYEFTRQFAPYVGVVHERVFGDTASLRRASGGTADNTWVVVGVSTWF